MKTAERTIERPRVERAAQPETGQRSMITPMAVVIALLVGFLAGFLLWGLNDTNPRAVAVGGDNLTDRQEQMVDFVDDAKAAWQQGDGDAVAAMFTEDGVMTIWGTEYRGGEIARYVDSDIFASLEVFEPVLVSDNEMITFHTVAGFGTLNEFMEFTPEGELLIINHEISG